MDWMNPLSGVLQQNTGSAASPARSNVQDDYQPASMNGRVQSKAGALSDARKLVQEAVDVANGASTRHTCSSRTLRRPKLKMSMIEGQKI